jgi:MarR family transcriptional regulator, organic hydroperoxide resistance regulator
MTAVSEQTRRREVTLEQVRLTLGELFGAERRLRGREQGRGRELTLSQIRALVVLEQEEEATAGDLAKSAGLNPASVTAMLDQLESNGIVIRRRSTDDRRVCMVSLTEAGRAVVGDERVRWQELWEEHLKDLSEPQLLAAVEVMRTITQLLETQ